MEQKQTHNIDDQPNHADNQHEFRVNYFHAGYESLNRVDEDGEAKRT